MRLRDLLSASYFDQLIGRDGLAYEAWKNPPPGEFANAVVGAAPHDGMRCMLTEDDFYVWQSTALLHDDFTRQTGIIGVRLNLRRDAAFANLEVVAHAEDFPWIFGDADLDIVQRQQAVADWLHANCWLGAAYGSPTFPIIWYS